MNHKTIISFLGIGIIAFLFSSCGGIKVSADYDKSVDFTQYKTFEYYGWAKESNQLINDLDEKRIEDAFGKEFNSRGLTYVESGGDLVVTLFIVIQQKTETVANSTGGYGGYYGGYYGYGPGYGWGPSYGTTTISTYDYQVGTLVCDVYDKANEKLIWEGIGSNTIKEDPKGREKRIAIAVAAIMKQYPVMPKEEK
jgi:hypothetical protein